MRQIKLLIICIFAITSSFAQTFEGLIIYEVKYKSKMPNATDAQLASLMGTTQEYFIKNGDYKSQVNGALLQWQLYINKDNKLYNKMSNSTSVLWNDGNINADEVLSSTINKNVVEILGYKCDELILNCRSGVQKYYFTTDLKLDAKLYEKHKYGNWSEYVSKTHSIPLKMIVDNQQLTIETVATSVKPMKLDDKFFQLPADSKLEKSPY